MKKRIALLLITALMLTGLALAEQQYRRDDISFTYDENAFEIVLENKADDEQLVELRGKAAAWGETFIRIYLADMDDGDVVPSLEYFKDRGIEATQGAWGRFENAFTYQEVDSADALNDSFFVVPIQDDDGDVDDILTVQVGVTMISDEAVAMERDDLISNVLDTLVIDD